LQDFTPLWRKTPLALYMKNKTTTTKEQLVNSGTRDYTTSAFKNLAWIT